MKKSQVAITVEYFTLRFFCALVNALPYTLALALARGLGWTAFCVFGFKRRRTLDRIRSVFPEKSRRECRRIAVRSLQNVLATGMEMMRAPRLTREWMDRQVKNGRVSKEKLQALVDEGRGVVIMVPHCGNWYMAAWAMAKYGLPLFALAARQRNPKINAWMNRQYGDIEVLDRDCRDTLGRIREKLAAGGAFAILPDLHVRKRDVTVDFLGGTANVSHAGAAFAIHAGCPIVVAAMRREGGHHVLEHLATLRPDASASDRRTESVRLTREVLSILDGEIRRHPDQWYWFNKRWILEPPRERAKPGANML